MTLKRLRALVQVAARIANPADSLGREARKRFSEASDLSAQGVELALTEHLETSPSDDELEALLASVTHAPRCHVVLAANVCTAPLRAIASALATSERVFVKPSRRDPVLAAMLVNTLAWPNLTLVSEIQPTAGDAVHVYGSDETIRTIRRALPAQVTLHAHGTGLGVAVVSQHDDFAVAANAIARDLVPFDGGGCLSPRLVVTDGDATRLAAALHAKLDAMGSAVPRGPLDADLRAALSQVRRLFATIGHVHSGDHHAVFVDEAPTAIHLAPPVRATVVIRHADVLAPIADAVTAIGSLGSSTLLNAILATCGDARVSALGQMQKPPLDGPVDLRSRS